MSEYKVQLLWKRYSLDFNIKNFNRDHIIQFHSGSQKKLSSAPQYFGNPQFANPEEFFVSSLSSCHMLTFLAIISMKNWIVDEYEDYPIGYLEKK